MTFQQRNYHFLHLFIARIYYYLDDISFSN